MGAGDSPEGLQLDAFIARALSDGVPVRETVRDMASGRLFSLLAASHPDGGCVITFDDVTDTARLAEQHRKVLDTVSDAIVITGLNGRITFANPAAHQLFGRQNLVGELTATLVVDSSIQEVESQERNARRGLSSRYECEVMHADGTTRTVQVSSAPLVELDEVTGTVSCLRDVTVQRADSVARLRSEALYHRLVENATDAIFTVDLQARFTSVNAGFLNEAGLTREQIIGQHFLTLVDPADRALAEKEMRATLSGERRKVQVRCITAAGSRITAVTSAPFEENGQIVGALGIVRDITNDEIRRETTLQQARLAAVGQSLGRVANELNNPLASLLAVAELQVTSPTMGADDRRAVAQIVHEARRASQIVGQLLDTTGEAPQLGGTRAPVDVNTVLRRALDHHSYTMRSLDVVVRSELAPALRYVDGDGLQLQQVISNLITNAEQALCEHHGRRELFVQSAMDGETVRISVSDTGPGILPQHLDRVMEPMFTTRGTRGHRGLGLTITHTIVRDHGGRLEVQSRPGEGACFTIVLPALSEAITREREAALRAVQSLTPAMGLPATSNGPARGQSILLVEDETTLRTAISRFLRTSGYLVEATDNGSAALDLLKDRQFDLILLDLRMKGITGEDVYETMQAMHPEQAQRVVFVTGDLHSAQASRFIRLTGRPVLAKPFTLAELAQRVGQLLV